jgi:hypothetical protein
MSLESIDPTTGKVLDRELLESFYFEIDSKVRTSVKEKKTGELKFSYRIEGAYSPYGYVDVEISGTGEGKLSYEFYGMGNKKPEERVIPFKVDPSTIEEFKRLYQEIDFFNLELTDLNKHEIRVTDHGTTTLTYSDGKKEGIISYGYAEDNPLAELIRRYYELVKDYLPDRYR